MDCRLTAILLAFSLSSAAWGQIAKPANPVRLELEIMVVTVAAETRHGGFDEELVRNIHSAVTSNESKPLSALHEAVRRVLPREREMLAAAVDSYTLNTYADLGQHVNFATAFAHGEDHHPQGIPSRTAQTKVTATPWILDEERYGLGVTVLSEVPLIVTGHHAPREREQTEITSNTLVNENEARVIYSRSHADAHVQTLLLLVGRVSR